MYGTEVKSSEVRKTLSFESPLKRRRDKSYKMAAGALVMTCLTSDFFIEAADAWRADAWRVMKERSDLTFMLFTKRIDRFRVSLPDDWGDGYDNVIICCSVENQDRADYRLPIFRDMPIKHRVIACAPLLEPINLAKYLDSKVEEVSLSGESGLKARLCNYDWILDIRAQCVEADIAFLFHQTGANFQKDGRQYRVKSANQRLQAEKANINYKLVR